MLVDDVNIDGWAGGCTQIKREVRWKRGLLADTLMQLCDRLVVLSVRVQLRLQPTNANMPCFNSSSFVYYHIVNSVCWSHSVVSCPTSKRPNSDAGLRGHSTSNQNIFLPFFHTVVEHL